MGGLPALSAMSEELQVFKNCCARRCQFTVLSTRWCRASPSGKRTPIRLKDDCRERTLFKGGLSDRRHCGQSHGCDLVESDKSLTHTLWNASLHSSHCNIAPMGAFWQTHTLRSMQSAVGRSFDSFAALRLEKASISLTRNSSRAAI